VLRYQGRCTVRNTRLTLPSAVRTEAVRSEPRRREPSENRLSCPPSKPPKLRRSRRGIPWQAPVRRSRSNPVPSQVASTARWRTPADDSPEPFSNTRTAANSYSGGPLIVVLAGILLLESPLYLSQTTSRLFGLESQSSRLSAFAGLSCQVGLHNLRRILASVSSRSGLGVECYTSASRPSERELDLTANLSCWRPLRLIQSSPCSPTSHNESANCTGNASKGLLPQRARHTMSRMPAIPCP
jgi:hypothetical protein